MILKYLMIYTVLLSTYLSVTPLAFAEPARLSNEFALHIPVIQYQDQYLWADLDMMQSSDATVYFKLRDYGSLVDTDIPPAVNSLTLVTEGLPVRIVDISATSARLTFISSIPLACSVVYGKTLNFDSIATDANMNGGAIIDHNPILINLEPDTQYYYRVQGTDAQGKLYWHPAASFTTTSASEQPKNFLSLNNGATISSVSSNFSGVNNNQAWGANSAIDGSAATAWSSAGDGSYAFITIALAQAEPIKTLRVWSRSMRDGSAKILSFTVTMDSGEVLGPFDLPDTQKAYDFPINRTTSSVRLDVKDSTGGNTGLVEIEAF